MKNKLYLILLIILGILPSCIEYVNMDSREEMPVVVNCVLTRDTVQTLRLYRMRVLSETGNVPVEGATVFCRGRTITENSRPWQSSIGRKGSTGKLSSSRSTTPTMACLSKFQGKRTSLPRHDSRRICDLFNAAAEQLQQESHKRLGMTMAISIFITIMECTLRKLEKESITMNISTDIT